MQTEEILKAVCRIGKKYQAKEMILFGSRAKGTSGPRSDFDIAVAGVHDFDALEESIDEIPTLYSFDVINLDTCKNELLVKEIREYGRKIL